MIAQKREPVAVVGAGPGGLGVAMLLAASGVPVRVYEAEPRIGGRTSRIQRGPFAFDRGPTFFLMPYVLEEIFAATGRRLTDYAELHRLDPMYRLIVGAEGGRGAATVLDATQDLVEMGRRIGEIEPRDAEAFEAFIRENRRKLELMTPILRSPMRSVADLMKLSTLKVAPYIHPLQTVAQYLEKRFTHPAVRLALSFQSKYLGMSPRDCPSLFSILPFIEYEYGIWHPTGGCNTLMSAMARVCEEMGVEFECGSPVERVVTEGGRTTGVIVRGEHRPHAHVVVNADAAWALKHLLPAEARRAAGVMNDAQVDARKYSCSTYMMYLGIRGEVDLPHHTIYISGRYKDNLDEISCGGTLSEDPSVYVCNPSRIDPTLAPPGHSSLYVLMPTPNLKVSGAGIEWSAGGQGRALARERLLSQLETVFGIKDVGSRIVVEETVAPTDWAASRINFGATFNMAHSLDQMLHRRVQHRLPGFEGVWFVGGGTHPGSGLPVIWLSSQIAARLMCEEFGVEYAGESFRDRPLAVTGDAGAPRLAGAAG